MRATPWKLSQLGFKVLKVKPSSAGYMTPNGSPDSSSMPVNRYPTGRKWSMAYAVARERLRMLEDIGLDIIEQPLPQTIWEDYKSSLETLRFGYQPMRARSCPHSRYSRLRVCTKWS